MIMITVNYDLKSIIYYYQTKRERKKLREVSTVIADNLFGDYFQS